MDKVMLNSSAFEPNGPIPAKYTCEGEDVSPALTWSGVPSGTKSLALIVDDPDAPDPAAPKMTWVHWVLFDVPPAAKGLPEAVGASSLPRGTREGLNDWKRTGYRGPCPPIGRHRYFFLARYRARRSRRADEGAARKGDGGTHPRRGAAGRHVPEVREVGAAESGVNSRTRCGSSVVAPCYTVHGSPSDRVHGRRALLDNWGLIGVGRPS